MDRLENIDFCIRYLMRQGGIEAEVPPTLEGKQRLLRALCNVWQPQPLSDDYLNAQDAELQAQMEDKGVVVPEGSGITLWQGDITRLQVDAIVNAANSQGLGCWHPLHSCIDNAIHSAAGIQLRQACNDILKGRMIKTGEAIIHRGPYHPDRCAHQRARATTGRLLCKLSAPGRGQRLPQHRLLLHLHGRVSFPQPQGSRNSCCNNQSISLNQQHTTTYTVQRIQRHRL